jgi:hypothetical protein
MYVVETIRDKDTNSIFYRCLHDIKSDQLKSWQESYKDNPCRSFYKVTANNAHNWIRHGGLHTTGLYMDGNRIRKAQINS